MQLKLEHTTTNFTQYWDNIDDISTNSFFYEFLIDTSQLQDGEYLLSLYDDDNIKLCDTLVKIGEYQSTKITYNKKKKYITYGK